MQHDNSEDAIRRMCQIPKGMPIAPYREKPVVELPPGLQEIPLLDPKKGPEHQVQRRLVAHVRVFDLCKAEDIDDYERVWQMVCDGNALISEHKTEFVESRATFIAMLRWSQFEYKLPQTGEFHNGQ